MREFQAAAPGRLRVLSVGAKILYSSFAIATLVGLLVSWRLYGAAVGEAGSAAYYAGATPAPTASAGPAASAAAGDGPAIDLAAEDQKPRAIVVQISDRKLLEVTHFHLFSMAVYVLILAHLWLLAKLPGWLSQGGVLAAVVTTALHVGSPWIARGRPALAPLVGGSAVAMLVVLGVMALWSMIDMWLPNPKGRGAPGGPAATS